MKYVTSSCCFVGTYFQYSSNEADIRECRKLNLLGKLVNLKEMYVGVESIFYMKFMIELIKKYFLNTLCEIIRLVFTPKQKHHDCVNSNSS